MLAAREREHVREERPRFEACDSTRAKLANAFHAAVIDGDLAAFARILADDAVCYTDGGGKRAAALKPIFGKDKILRFVAGVASKRGPVTAEQLEHVQMNGLPGSSCAPPRASRRSRSRSRAIRSSRSTASGIPISCATSRERLRYGRRRRTQPRALTEFVTLDRIMQASGGPDEDRDGDFAHGGSSRSYWHDDIGARFGVVMQDVDAFLLGRRTYVTHAQAFEPMRPATCSAFLRTNIVLHCAPWLHSRPFSNRRSSSRPTAMTL